MSAQANLRCAGHVPWVLVAGSFHNHGGTDRANAALAKYLATENIPVHLVSHEVGDELAAMRSVIVHRVPKPVNSLFLGQAALDRRGRAVAGQVSGQAGGSHVVVNGANCDWPDVNWVHCVHHAWDTCDHAAPIWFKAKNWIDKRQARRSEQIIFRRARLLLANSERTRRDLINYLHVDPERIKTVHLGIDKDWPLVTPQIRAASRAWLRVPFDRPLVVFVGALGHDRNKGFDTLWRAWLGLCHRPEWDAHMAVVGGGRAVSLWGEAVSKAAMQSRVTVLGASDRVRDVLAAADLLVSPVRYEAYGLNVHEAICTGIPALVSAQAGIAERYPDYLRDLLLPDPEHVDALATSLLRWRAHMSSFQHRLHPFTEMLRRRTWEDMAREIVSLVVQTKAAAAV